MVAHLQSMGLIEAASGAVAQHSKSLVITAAGKELRDRVMPGLRTVQDRIMAPLSDTEREALRDMLARIIKANEAMTGPANPG